MSIMSEKNLKCPVKRISIPVRSADKYFCPVSRPHTGRNDYDDSFFFHPYCSQTQELLMTEEKFMNTNTECYQQQKEEAQNENGEGLDDILYSDTSDLFSFFKQQLKEKIVTIPDTFDYISDFFALNTPSWENDKTNCIGFIIAGTGTGKTTYVKNLLEKGWNVLYIANRKMIVEQVKKSLSGFGNALIMTYQELATNAKYTVDFLNSYDFVIADECHALQVETTYDPYLNVAYDRLIRANRTKRLFMSATADCILDRVLSDYRRILKNDAEFLKRICIVRSEMKKVNVKHTYSFDDLEDLVTMIKQSGHKWISFVRSKTQGKHMLDLLREAGVQAGFICREGLDDGDAIMKRIYESICMNKKFDFDVLVTTRLSDCGVSIEDEDVKSIVLFEKNEVCVRQELGRKRQLSVNDGIDVYISNDSASTINGLLTQLKMTIKRYHFIKCKLESCAIPDPLIRNGKINDEYRKAVFKDPLSSHLKFNWIGLDELRKEQTVLLEMVRNHSIVDLVLQWIEKATGQKHDAENIIDDKQIFSDIMLSYAGQKIDRSDLIDFRKKITRDYIDVFGYENPNDRPKNPFSIKKINERLLLKGIPIRINNTYQGCASKHKLDGVIVTKLFCPVKRLG